MKYLLILLISNMTFALDFNSAGMQLKQDFLPFSFQGRIWGFDFLDQDTIVFSGKRSGIYTYKISSNKLQKLNGTIPDADTMGRGQGGLLDILVHNGLVYLTYSKKVQSSYTTALISFKVSGQSMSDIKEIYTARAVNRYSHHYGSRLLIKDNQIYMTVGDRGERNKAQQFDNDHGSILRLNLDGSIPSDNPKFGNSSPSALFSKGHRNPQGIALSPVSNKIINGEFGPQGGDEINLVKKGANYGWPTISYGEEYGGGRIGEEVKPGLEQPLHYWTPSISFSGINFYTGNKLSAWKNNLFLASLARRHIRRVVLDSNHKVVSQEELLKDLRDRIRMIRESKSGDLYFSTDSGKIGRITLK